MAFALAPVTVADATFSAAGAAAWAAGFIPSGATVGGVPYCTSATAWTTTSALTFNASGAAGEGLAISAGTAASAVSALTVSGEVNYNAAALNFIDISMKDTSSHASTNAFRIRGGAAGTTDLLTVTKAGAIIAGSASVKFSSSADSTTGMTPGSGLTLFFASGVNYWSYDVVRIYPATDNAYNLGTAGLSFGTNFLYTSQYKGVAYANRPGTPVAGMVINITDSNTATWGATVAAGGANNVLARYNGTNWTVVGA